MDGVDTVDELRGTGMTRSSIDLLPRIDRLVGLRRTNELNDSCLTRIHAALAAAPGLTDEEAETVRRFEMLPDAIALDEGHDFIQAGRLNLLDRFELTDAALDRPLHPDELRGQFPDE